MSIFFQDESLTLLHGDALEQLRGLPSQSVHAIVTSPPYYGLRDYGAQGQYGLEASPQEYVQNLQNVFREARRVLHDQGTLWLNLGDTYSSRPGWGRGGTSQLAGRKHAHAQDAVDHHRPMAPKNLLGIPWRTALALQDDGWILRNDIIWDKPNGLPESVKDRFSTHHEHLFLFSKESQYYFDLNALRESPADASLDRARRRTATDTSQEGVGSPNTLDPAKAIHPAGKNPGDVWKIPAQPFTGAHCATMPFELARRAVIAGCAPAGTVLDPFSGSGTSGQAAQHHGRKYVGIDLNADYLQLSLTHRLNNRVFDFDGVA